jgi:DNA-binding ferritin-like protein
MDKGRKTNNKKEKTNNKKRKSNLQTRKQKISNNSNNSNNSNFLPAFQKEITVIFLEMILIIKLYHWKTTSYATHKATDDLYTKLNANMDSFIEVLLGKTGSRTDLMDKKTIRLTDLSSPESLKREIDEFKKYLVNLNENKAMKQMLNTDLYNIRDTILGDLNQFLYLLTFK